MPYFSVIIPLYNKESFIEKTLECVLNQTFKDFEIIIVNDGSTDNGLEKIKKFTDNRIKIFQQENQGVSVARNKGMEMAEGEYFCFLDADDEWKNDCLENFYKAIVRFSDYLVFSAAIEIETEKKTIPAQYALTNFINDCYFIENFFKASTKFSIIWTSCTAFHRSVFKLSGNFDPSIKSGQDLDLWIRIGSIYEVVFINKILAKYVFDGKSLSRNILYKKSSKIKYSKFKALEETHPEIKVFLDLNRYSEIITSKLTGNYDLAKKLKKDVKIKNLTPKKIFLMTCPVFVLKFFIRIQPILIKYGLRNTFYK